MKSITAIFALSLLAMTVGCASTTKSAFSPSPIMPGVENAIEFNPDVNGNNRVKFNVKYLPPANTLVPAKTFYVVWAQSPEGRTIPLGRLWIGGTRTGAFEATVPFLEFRLVVTAEDDTVPQSPAEPFILSSELLKAEAR